MIVDMTNVDVVICEEWCRDRAQGHSRGADTNSNV